MRYFDLPANPNDANHQDIAFAMSECVRAMKTEFQGASTNYKNKAQSDSDFELELNRCILLGRGFYTQNEGNGGMWVR